MKPEPRLPKPPRKRARRPAGLFPFWVFVLIAIAVAILAAASVRLALR